MIDLVKYTSDFKEVTVNRMADFFESHANLINGNIELDENRYHEIEETLTEWTKSSHELHFIKLSSTEKVDEKDSIGFLHIGYRGENVAWIEDIFIDENFRKKGFATQTIKAAEDIIKSNPAYTAICFDVVPRNNFMTLVVSVFKTL